MLKKARVGLIIWGAILSVVGLYFLLGALHSLAPNDYTTNQSTAASTALILCLFGLFILSGGVLMLVFGIINAVKTKKYNKSIENDLYVARCFVCGTEVRCNPADFTAHRNYPEGFRYCPVCRKPLSRNAFTLYPGQYDNSAQDPPQYPQQAGYPDQYAQPNGAPAQYAPPAAPDQYNQQTNNPGQQY